MIETIVKDPEVGEIYYGKVDSPDELRRIRVNLTRGQGWSGSYLQAGLTIALSG